MGKRHDENRDLRAMARIGKIDSNMKVITITNKDSVGIHTLGRIDFLRRYCGWSIIWNTVSNGVIDASNSDFKEKARSKNAHVLTNKNTRKK